MLMRSPSSIRPMGPPEAASGLTWPMAAPRDAPEKRPSVMRGPRSIHFRAGQSGGGWHFAHTGPPLGPHGGMTTTLPERSGLRRWRNGGPLALLNTRARPECCTASGATAFCAATQPSGRCCPTGSAGLRSRGRVLDGADGLFVQDVGTLDVSRPGSCYHGGHIQIQQAPLASSACTAWDSACGMKVRHMGWGLRGPDGRGWGSWR